MNFKNIILSLLTILIISCQSDDDGGGDFNYQKQYDSEKSIIDAYLKSHYYDDETKLFQDLKEGEKALIQDEKLKEIEVSFNDVLYKMYVYVFVEGVGGEIPDSNDRVNIISTIFNLENEELSSNKTNDGATVSLPEQIESLKQSLLFLKSGTVSEEIFEEPRQYLNFGEGLVITPSGLTFLSEGLDLNTRRGSTVTTIRRIGLRFVTKIEDEQ